MHDKDADEPSVAQRTKSNRDGAFSVTAGDVGCNRETFQRCMERV